MELVEVLEVELVEVVESEELDRESNSDVFDELLLLFIESNRVWLDELSEDDEEPFDTPSDPFVLSMLVSVL